MKSNIAPILRQLRMTPVNRRRRAARAAVESLEGRTLLSGIVVNSFSDASPAGVITLRDAVTTANASTTPTTITFDPTVFATPQTIVLSGTELEFTNTTDPTTITGSPGVTLSGNRTIRILRVNTGVTASITGLTFTAGDDSVSPGMGGGAIYNEGGNLTLNNCTLTGNNASDHGGGLFADGNAKTMMNEDVVSNNTSTNQDGGIANYGSGTMVLTNSTVSGNTSANYGGGIENDATMTLVNDTIANNVTNSAFGGGIENFGSGVISLTNVTVAGNTCNSSSLDGGGGISNNGGAFTLANSIIAGNTVTGAQGPDALGTFTSLGHNLIGQKDTANGLVTSDLGRTTANPLNADLAPLADNFGPTQTMLPLAGSPAIDAGSNALIATGDTADQRGLQRIVNGTVDIGAVEVQLPPTQLAFISTPASLLTGTTLTSVTVDVEDANGIVVPTDNSNVTIAIASGPAGALSGTTTVAAQAGIATFSNLVLTGAAIYKLIASDGALTAATSASIKVTPPPSLLVPTLRGVSLPTSVIVGSKIKGKVTVVVTDTGSPLKGTINFKLYADTTTGLDGKEVLGAAAAKHVSLKTGKSQSFVFNLNSLPSTLAAGTYHLLAQVIDPSGLFNVVATTQTVQVAAAFVQPAISVGLVTPGSIAVGKAGSISVTVSNQGNVAASGIDISLSPSSDGSTPITGYILGTLTSGVSVQPHKSKKFNLRFKVTSADAAGTYLPYVSLSLSGVKATLVGTVPFVIQ